MKKSRSANSGFTIIELLVVVVIIAVLAAITIFALNSIQTRARNSAALATSHTFTKKVSAYYQLVGSYPSNTSTVVSTLATYRDSSLGTANSIVIGTPSSSNGTNTLKVELCGAGAGVKVIHFDFLAGTLSTTVTNIGNVSGTCVSATA